MFHTRESEILIFLLLVFVWIEGQNGGGGGGGGVWGEGGGWTKPTPHILVSVNNRTFLQVAVYMN